METRGQCHFRPEQTKRLNHHIRGASIDYSDRARDRLGPRNWTQLGRILRCPTRQHTGTMPGQGAFDEAGDGGGALVWVQLSVGHPRVIVDDSVGVLHSPSEGSRVRVPLPALSSIAMTGTPTAVNHGVSRPTNSRSSGRRPANRSM